MSVKVLILEDNPVARDFLSRVLRESFSDPISITEAGDLETAPIYLWTLAYGLGCFPLDIKPSCYMSVCF